MWLLEPATPVLKGPHTTYLFDSILTLAAHIKDCKSVDWIVRFVPLYVPPPPKEDNNQKVTQPLIPLSRSKDS